MAYNSDHDIVHHVAVVHSSVVDNVNVHSDIVDSVNGDSGIVHRVNVDSGTVDSGTVDYPALLLIVQRCY